MVNSQLPIRLNQTVDLPRALLEHGIHFEMRPAPVPSGLRLVWRLALVTLTMRICCRNYRTSLQRLQVLNWALRSSGARSILLAAIEGHKRPEDVIVRYEPAFTRVISFAAAEGLILSPADKRLELTASGEALAEDVLEADDCLVPEKSFLLTLGQRVTEDWINRLVRITVSR